MRVAQEVGGVALLIDAKNESVAQWYRGYGAVSLLDAALSLVLPFATVADARRKGVDRSPLPCVRTLSTDRHASLTSVTMGQARRSGRLIERLPYGDKVSAFNEETVLDVRHWTDRLFSFRTTRNPSFRFRNGEFTMIGIRVDGKPLLRAYSVASANYEDQLEFLSIKVPDGPLTSRLQNIKAGDPVMVSRKATGTLVIDNLVSGRNLYLLATGTGLAPFLSVIKDPETYDRFERIVLVHGCRHVSELAYEDDITRMLPQDEMLGELVSEKLLYYPTVTREAFRNQGRITALLEAGTLQADLALAPLDPAQDRAMICGGPHMMSELKLFFEGRGFIEGNHGEPGQFVVEKAFVDR